MFVPVFAIAGYVITVVSLMLILVLAALLLMFAKLFQKVEQGTALVRNGLRGTQVSFSGMFIVPLIDRMERMDISVKRIEIFRHGSEGLICRDNIRADIKVVFFVRVNKTPECVMQVAQFVGCQRASEESALVDLFDAKFSEALKTVGKQFDFVDLYNSRDRFREEILKIIGTDLNGYVLDDAAIDFLEQTPLAKLNPDNILDAEGIKKITDLTAKQQILANNIRREKEKVITKQDVEAREAILELQRQQAEAEEKQKREISEVKSRETAESQIVSQQQRLRAEQARIASDEEIQIAEENRLRQVLVAQKSKERTNAVESERVEKDRMLEATERERIVALAQIEKEKALEQERKVIQNVIRDRVMVERTVAEEEEKIKDTRELAAADRLKQVAIREAEMEAEQAAVKQVKSAEAAKQAAALRAEEIVIEADARRSAAERETDAKKLLADGISAESAAAGMAQVKVTMAEAEAVEKKGTAEARILQLKFQADAEGINQKAEAMRKLDAAGRDHEEFKLRLDMERAVELKRLEMQAEIARNQAEMLAAALKSARIDIVGGESTFFDKIVNSISQGKSLDRFVENSRVVSELKDALLTDAPHDLLHRVRELIGQFGLTTDDVKNLSIAALTTRLMSLAGDGSQRREIEQLMAQVHRLGLGTGNLVGLLDADSNGSAKK